MADRTSSGLDIDLNADGFDITGGTTPRRLRLSGGDVAMVGGGAAVITYPAATGTLATLTLEENIPLAVDVILSADGRYSGVVQAGVAGPALAFGDLVYLDTSVPDWKLADADTIAASGTPMLGVCVLAASAGAATTVLRYGSVRADAAFPTFTAGQLFVSQTAGDITNTAPTATDTVRRVVGHAITGDAMFFQPSPDYITNV